jgi:large subunit ribosomal protein L24
MASLKIKKGDSVKVIAGSDKGKITTVIAVLPEQNAVLLDGIGKRKRHVKPTQVNPKGGKKDIHIPTPTSKIALIVEKSSAKTSRIGWLVKPDGSKVRVARSLKNKEIK